MPMRTGKQSPSQKGAHEPSPHACGSAIVAAKMSGSVGSAATVGGRGESAHSNETENERPPSPL